MTYCDLTLLKKVSLLALLTASKGILPQNFSPTTPSFCAILRLLSFLTFLLTLGLQIFVQSLFLRVQKDLLNSPGVKKWALNRLENGPQKKVSRPITKPLMTGDWLGLHPEHEISGVMKIRRGRWGAPFRFSFFWPFVSARHTIFANANWTFGYPFGQGKKVLNCDSPLFLESQRCFEAINTRSRAIQQYKRELSSALLCSGVFL